MSCEWKHHVDRLISGGLSPDAETKVTHHLESCEACRDEHAWLLAERRLFRGRAREQAPLPIPSFDAVFLRAHQPATGVRGVFATVRAELRRTLTDWRIILAQAAVVGATSVVVFTAVKHVQPAAPDRVVSPDNKPAVDRWSRLTAMDGEAACKDEQQGAETSFKCQSVVEDIAPEARPAKLGAERDHEKSAYEPVSSYDADRGCADMCVAESM